MDPPPMRPNAGICLLRAAGEPCDAGRRQTGSLQNYSGDLRRKTDEYR